MSTIDLEYTDDYEARLYIKSTGSRTVEVAVFEDGYRSSFETSANELIAIAEEVREGLGAPTPPIAAPELEPDVPASVPLSDNGGLYGVSNSPYSEDQPTEFRMNAATFANALVLGLGVRFRYVKNENSDPIKRELSEVTELLTTKDGEHVVIGYDSDRDDFRSYRLDRIKGFVRVRD